MALLLIMPSTSTTAGSQASAVEDPENLLDSAYCGGTRLDGDASQGGLTVGTGVFVQTEPRCRGWMAKTDAGDGSGEDTTDVVYAASGDVIVTTGPAYRTATGSDLFTVGRDASTGQELWTHALDSGDGRNDGATDLVADPDNDRVYVLGHYGFWSSDEDMAIVAYDATTGTLLWERQVTFFGEDEHPRALTISADGSTLVAVGTVTDPNFQADYGVVSVDPASGQVRWTATYAGAGGTRDRATAVATSPDGSTVAVTGGAIETTAYSDVTTVAFDRQGNQLWTHTYTGSGDENAEAQEITFTPDGQTVLVASNVRTSSFSWDQAVHGLNAGSGTQLWTNTQDVSYRDLVRDLALSPDGRSLVVAGVTRGSNGWDATAWELSTEDGSTGWATSFDGGVWNDEFHGIAFSPTGDRLMAGGLTTPESGGHDMLMASLDPATGQFIWTDSLRSHPDSSSEGTAVALSPDGTQVALGADLGSPDTADDQGVAIWYTDTQGAVLGESGADLADLRSTCELVLSQALCQELFPS